MTFTLQKASGVHSDHSFGFWYIHYGLQRGSWNGSSLTAVSAVSPEGELGRFAIRLLIKSIPASTGMNLFSGIHKAAVRHVLNHMSSPPPPLHGPIAKASLNYTLKLLCSSKRHFASRILPCILEYMSYMYSRIHEFPEQQLKNKADVVARSRLRVSREEAHQVPRAPGSAPLRWASTQQNPAVPGRGCEPGPGARPPGAALSRHAPPGARSTTLLRASANFVRDGSERRVDRADRARAATRGSRRAQPSPVPHPRARLKPRRPTAVQRIQTFRGRCITAGGAGAGPSRGGGTVLAPARPGAVRPGGGRRAARGLTCPPLRRDEVAAGSVVPLPPAPAQRRASGTAQRSAGCVLHTAGLVPAIARPPRRRG